MVEIPTPVVETLPTVYIVAERAPKVTPRKRICDRRGNTQGMGYAVPRETVIANETVATVCWTE